MRQAAALLCSRCQRSNRFQQISESLRAVATRAMFLLERFLIRVWKFFNATSLRTTLAARPVAGPTPGCGANVGCGGCGANSGHRTFASESSSPGAQIPARSSSAFSPVVRSIRFAPLGHLTQKTPWDRHSPRWYGGAYCQGIAFRDWWPTSLYRRRKAIAWASCQNQSAECNGSGHAAWRIKKGLRPFRRKSLSANKYRRWELNPH